MVEAIRNDEIERIIVYGGWRDVAGTSKEHWCINSAHPVLWPFFGNKPSYEWGKEANEEEVHESVVPFAWVEELCGPHSTPNYGGVEDSPAIGTDESIGLLGATDIVNV